jgi:Cu+-exporting ATPase
VLARGVATRVGRSVVRVGSRRFMLDNRIDLAPAENEVMRLAHRGDNILYVARGRKLIGVLGVQDALRENMKKALNRLRQSGMDDIILLTGDVEQHAEIVASRMAMDRFEAEVLPEDKAETILKLQQKGTRVVMVGDGINDAPALAQADVGLAIGTGTDVAIESADVVLMSGDLRNVPNAIALSRATLANIRQNLFWAFAYNTLLIPVAAGVLYPAFGLLLSPIFAAAAMGLSSVFVVTNALRLRRFRPPMAAEVGSVRQPALRAAVAG